MVYWDAQYNPPFAVTGKKCADDLQEFKFNGWAASFVIVEVGITPDGELTNFGVGIGPGAGIAWAKCTATPK
jgi:hypothetical protein